MRKVTKIFKNCFCTGQVDCDGVEKGPAVEAAAVNTPRRPPVFPTKTRKDKITRVELRPQSPFETRLRRLGQKIENEFSKEDALSEATRLRGSKLRSDGGSVCSDSSWNCFRGIEAVSEKDVASEGSRRESQKLAFVSIDSSETEISTRLDEELLTTSNNLWLQGAAAAADSCASTASFRDLTRTQYMFYEDDEDVVMEFFPSVKVLQQAS